MGTRRRIGSFCVLLLLAASSVSCVLRGPSSLKRELADATGATYEREFGLTLGRTSMAIARLGVRFSDDEELPVMLKGVKGVQVGVYRVVDDGRRDPVTAARMELFEDWEPIVTIREPGERVLVMQQTRDDRIRRMLVVVDDADELVIVRIKGKLDRVIEDAVLLGLERAGHEEYGEAALAQLEDRDATSAS